MQRKKEIRKQIIATRDLQTVEERRNKSSIIQEKVIGLDAFMNAETVLLYMDFHCEVQTDQLIQYAKKHQKKIGIPRIEHGEMTFYRLSDQEGVMPGYYGIPEPISQVVVEPEHAVVIVPGVAFDKRGMRIGYGKGFYDRFLRTHPNYVPIAIAYDCQIVEKVPAEEHDMTIPVIITETTEYKNK